MKALTGEHRFRLDGALLVLQVQERDAPDHWTWTGGYNSPSMEPTWRDARLEDFAAEKLLARPPETGPLVRLSTR